MFRPYMFRQGTTISEDGAPVLKYAGAIFIMYFLLWFVFYSISLSAFVGQYTESRLCWWNLTKYVKFDIKASEIVSKLVRQISFVNQRNDHRL